MRSFFTGRREQRVKFGDDKQRDKETKLEGKRIVRPRVTGIRNQIRQSDFGEERVETSVSVSSSVSTSRKVQQRPKSRITATTIKSEDTKSDSPTKTTRKRFRLIKNSKANQDSLLEKLLGNIDGENEVKREKNPIRQPSRFRPSIKRDQIRKKAESAFRPKDKNSRINLRIRTPITTTEKTRTTTQKEELEEVTGSNLLVRHSEVESLADQEVTTVVTETYSEVTQLQTLIAEGKESLTTTEKPNIPTRITNKSETTAKQIKRKQFFRRNNPRKFGLVRKPFVTPTVPEDVTVRELSVTTGTVERPNDLLKEKNLRFGSFPAFLAKEDKVQQQPMQAVEPVEILPIQPTSLPQLISNGITPTVNLIPSASQPTLQGNTRRNKIHQFQNSFEFPNSIVQPAFIKPASFKRPQPIPVVETQRNLADSTVKTRGQSNMIKPAASGPQTVKAQQPIIRETIFPQFVLPDFFKVPFASFPLPALSTPDQQTSLSQNTGGTIFSSIGQPLGTRQGQPRAANLNIKTGSYSIGW